MSWDKEINELVGYIQGLSDMDFLAECRLHNLLSPHPPMFDMPLTFSSKYPEFILFPE